MRKSIAVFALGSLGVIAHANLQFNLIPKPGDTIPAAVSSGFTSAANLWSSVFTDNVTIDIRIGYEHLGSNILGQTGSYSTTQSFSGFRTQLAADATSALDATAVASLGVGSSYNFLFNQDPNNLNDKTTQSSSKVNLTTANAKALGYTFTNLPFDAAITFSSDFAFDFDRSNGIAGDKYDFIGIATHEIGHALGFVSGVDDLDGNFGQGVGTFDNDHTSLDLFRFENFNGTNQRSFTAGNATKNFSANGGLTLGAQFANGVSYGDGRQASHWKDNLGLGILDPTAGKGELLSISENDLRAFDAIGWNRVQAVPEPTTLAAVGLGLLAMLRRRRR